MNKGNKGSGNNGGNNSAPKGAGFPSTTGNPSGKGRDNAPPKK